MKPVYYLQHTLTQQYVTSIIPLKDGIRAVYFGPKPDMQRWITQKGAEAALERLRKFGTNPPDVAQHLTITTTE